MKGITQFSDRVELLEWVNQNFKGGIAVEVGTASGCFAKQILASYTNLSKLYCIDLWAHQDEALYKDACNIPQEQQEERYEQIQKDFNGNDKVVLIREWSHLAVNQFEDGSIDFMYLDANHSYEPCLQDLNLWLPKIKAGGILAGHDYYEGGGVKQAVDEFAAANGIRLFSTTNEYSKPTAIYGAGWEGPSFYFQK